MATAFDSLHEGVLVADLNHILLFRNRMAQRLLGVSSGDAFIPVWESISNAAVAEFVATALQRQEPLQQKRFTLADSDRTRHLACAIRPLTRDGAVEGSILTVEDITEQLRNETRLRRAEHLASLTTLAATVAHEIKNPLGSISIQTQLIQRNLQSRSKGWRTLLETKSQIIMDEVDRLNEIVSSFLFAARPVDIAPRRADLNATIIALLEFVGNELRQRNIQYALSLGDALPLIDFDEQHIKQALLNVIKNAIEAMPNGGKIAIATRRDGNMVVARIDDNGPGIAPEIRDRIFEPYFSTKITGSGIGLMIADKIIKAHGGDIVASNIATGGCRFAIMLPIPQSRLMLPDDVCQRAGI